MSNILNSAEIIESLVSATYGEEGKTNEKRVLREALRGLVRLAKAEQMMELKANVSLLSGGVVTSKTLLNGNGLKHPDPFQHQLDFPNYH